MDRLDRICRPAKRLGSRKSRGMLLETGQVIMPAVAPRVGRVD